MAKLIEAAFDRPFDDAPSVTIGGVRIDALAFGEVVDIILEHASQRRGACYVVTPNAHHVVLNQNDEVLREIYRRAFLVVPDGVPLLWAARLLGLDLHGRVNGTDLFEALCAEAAQRGLGVYLLGGRRGAADGAATLLCDRYPGLRICGTYCPPFGFENDPAESERIVSAIRDARPDLLFVGLGAPKQEYWMSRHVDRIAVPVSLGVGVSFEFVAGALPRAPRWMQKAGLEWLFRLLVEPSRLWKRYLIGNARFCFIVMRQYLANVVGRCSSSHAPSVHSAAPESAEPMVESC
jgi:N-acetylglucosaminyldiphosphoundecaprenol N-acetyl-beta-D-mannosaminyltransferase